MRFFERTGDVAPDCSLDPESSQPREERIESTEDGKERREEERR